MTFNGYLSLGGNELLNSARVAAYADGLGITAISCQSCDLLPRALGDDPYTSPDQDDAPWWDPAVVASKDFAGVLGVEITGLDGPVNSREVVPLAGDGAALSPVRRKPREILVRAYLFARTDCALSYGRSWLAAAVRGGSCGLPCVGDDLCFLSCCPASCPQPLPGQEDPCGDAEWRTLYNVGVLEGPIPRSLTRVSGGFMQEVEFTLTAGNPFIFHVPKLVTTGPNPNDQLPATLSEDTVDCGEDVGCIQKALTDCPPLPLPLLPLMPPDPCFPVGLEFDNYRFVASVPRDITPLWLESVPYIRFRAGTSKLERVTLRWYSNPQEIDCKLALENPDPNLRPLGPCDTCAEVNIPVIPAEATLTFDGRLQRAWVDCPGGPGLDTAEPAIYGRGGTAFQWPVFGCGQSLCLEIIMRRRKTTPPTPIPTATWEIYTVAREDAS